MTTVTPEPILRAANGYMAAQYLFVANEINLFEHLAEQAASLEELAQKTGIAPRRLRILAEALVSLGFLEREQGCYKNTAVSEAFLCGRNPEDFRSALRFFRLRYPLWTQLENVLRTGEAARIEMTEEESAIFSIGIESGTVRTAQALAREYDFQQRRRLLDLGGGTGSFLTTILKQYGHLDTTLFDTPEVAQVARQRIADTAYARQVAIVMGDLFSDPLPPDHDAIMLNNVLHLFSAERNCTLLQRVRSQVTSGVQLLLVDSWTDTEQAQPSPIALIGGDFLLQTGEGDIYSEGEVRQWLAATNWRFIQRRPLVGATSLILAEA